jgi:hypothetical protein
MKMGRWVALAVLVMGSPAALAGKVIDPVVDLEITQLNSIPGGVVPQLASGNANSLFYTYEFPAGGSIVDSLPIELCAKGTAGVDKDGYATSGFPQTLSFSPSNGNLPGVTVPADVTFNASDVCETVYVYIDTGVLSLADTYKGNINISLVNAPNDPSRMSPVKTAVNVDKANEIHIQATVTAPEVSINCFTTDSAFNFLIDCNGAFVTSGATGTFAIVTNRKNIEVATNPGQFYYNLLYTNTSGADQTVAVGFARNGVVAHGAQAIHAMVFPSFPMYSYVNFDAVNNSIPSGADDKLEGVVVPAGWTLWVDYHLEWAGVSRPAPLGIGTSCPTANQTFGVIGTVSVDGTVVGTCGAGAVGYKK